MAGKFLVELQSVLARNTPSVIAYGDATFPKGTAFGGGRKVSGIAQRRPLGGAGCERSEQTEGVPAARLFPQETSAAAAVSRCVPSREKAIPENPQIFRNCEILNHFSADDAQSNAERIPNRPGSRTPAVLQKRRDVL